MTKENKDQLVQIDQVIVPDGIDPYHYPMDLTEGMLKKISNLSPEIRERHQFTVQCQGKTVFHDTKNGTIDVRHGAVIVTMIPFIS